MGFKEKFEAGISRIKSETKLKVYVGIAVVAVIALVGGIIVKHNMDEKAKESVIQTYTIPENQKIFINGVVVPKESKQIMGPLNGTIPDIRVSNGQKVNAGDVLYIVKDEASLQQIETIKAQISSLINEKRLLKSDDPALPSINGQIASLNSSLSAANARAYTKVTAPFSGRVFLNSHQQSGSALMTLQTTDYIMNGQVSEQDLSKIKLDMTATITVLPTGDTLKGRINYISDRPVPTKEAVSTAKSVSYYNVNLTFDSQDGVIDGYHLQAAIELNSDKHKVPVQSIVAKNGEIYVMADKDGVLKKVNVEVVKKEKNYAIVTGNLTPKEVIIKNPTKQMKDGDPAPIIKDGSSKDMKKKK